MSSVNSVLLQNLFICNNSVFVFLCKIKSPAVGGARKGKIEMPLNFSDIALTSDEWETLLTVRESAILLEPHNQHIFRRLEHHGFVEITSAYNIGSVKDVKENGIGVTKLAARITDHGKDFIVWMMSCIAQQAPKAQQEPPRNRIGFSLDSD